MGHKERRKKEERSLFAARLDDPALDAGRGTSKPVHGVLSEMGVRDRIHEALFRSRNTPKQQTYCRKRWQNSDLPKSARGCK